MKTSQIVQGCQNENANSKSEISYNSRAYCSLSGRLAADPTVCSDWGLLHLNYLPTSGHDKYDDHHGHDDHGGVDTKSLVEFLLEVEGMCRKIFNTFNTCQHFLVNTKTKLERTLQPAH